MWFDKATQPLYSQHKCPAFLVWLYTYIERTPTCYQLALHIDERTGWLSGYVFVRKIINWWNATIFQYTLGPRQNGLHSPDGIFKLVLYETDCSFIQISLKCVPESIEENKSALVRIMVWCWRETIIWIGISAVLLPRCRSNSRVIGKV